MPFSQHDEFGWWGGRLSLSFSQALNMAAGVAMPEIKTAGPSTGLLDRQEVSFETSVRPEDKVRKE